MPNAEVICTIRAFSLAAIVWALAHSVYGADAKAAVEVPLASALGCKFPHHVALGVRFSPANDYAAFLLQHAPEREGTLAHLLVVSRTGDPTRRPAYTRGPATTAQGPDLLWWSPDGKYVAALASGSVGLFRSDRDGRCDLPLGNRDVALGFVSGSLFVVDRFGSPERSLDFYSGDCARVRSAPSPCVSYDGIVIPPDGEFLAFMDGDGGVILTDPQAQNGRNIKPYYWTGLPRLWRAAAKGRYTESGKVLCIGSRSHTHCFENDSGHQEGTLPGGMEGRMLDAATAGARIVYPVRDTNLIDTAISLYSMAKTPGTGGASSRLVGCVVWDYRQGKEIFRWSAKTALIGKAPFAGGCAISAAGDRLALATSDSVRRGCPFSR